MEKPPTIAVIGAGFSGALTALHLLHTGPPKAKIFLIEKTAGFGRGLAYGSHNPRHLLNVRVGNMSAFPDDPDHLIRWLWTRAGASDQGAATFITRGAYGDYLAGLIQAAVAQPDGAERLVLVHDQAMALSFAAGRASLRLAMGRSLEIDAAVLALGNLPPLSPRGADLEALPTGLYAPDPWAADTLTDLDPEAPVLLLGTGLTMVDVALALAGRGHRGTVTALSRRGLAPHRHAPVAAVPGGSMDLGGELSDLLHRRRARARDIGWRAAVDELRPVTQDL